MKTATLPTPKEFYARKKIMENNKFEKMKQVTLPKIKDLIYDNFDRNSLSISFRNINVSWMDADSLIPTINKEILNPFGWKMKRSEDSFGWLSYEIKPLNWFDKLFKK
jgi:hypothetical protein